MRFIFGLVVGIVVGRIVSTPLPDSFNHKVADFVEGGGDYMANLASDMRSGLEKDGQQ